MLDAGEQKTKNKMVFRSNITEEIIYVKTRLRNRMSFLLYIEINNLHDILYKFKNLYKESELKFFKDEFDRLKKYLNDKLNLD